MKRGDEISFVLMSDFASVREALIKMMAAIQDNLDEEKALMVELALAETLNNIVEHAYGEVGGHEIHVDLAYDGQILCCAIADNGVPNPSLVNIEANTSQPVDMAEGGYGNGLINTLASEIEYRRADERNITKIWF